MKGEAMRAYLCASIVAALAVMSGCVSISVGTKKSPGRVEVGGLARGYASLDGLHPYNGTFVQLDLLERAARPGEFFSFELWPLCGVGVGFVGARVQVLPLDVGLGVLAYKPRKATVPPPPAQPESALEERMRAAAGISDSEIRGQACRAVALDAAAAGDAETTRKAVDSIADGSVRDSTASECAVKLAQAGRPEDARKIADRINAQPLRDETLQKIAAGGTE